jgi:phage tail protein X
MNLVHNTLPGDRWDRLAYFYYGDVAQMSLLIVSNKHLPVSEILPAGVQVFIPVMEATDDVANVGAPPWKD